MDYSEVSAGKHVSLWGFLLTIVLVVAGAVYLLKAAYSRDPLWFWSGFEATPSQVVIRCRDDRTIILGSASPDTGRIASLVNQQLSGEKRFDPMSLSDATFAYYQDDPGVVTLELIYAEPVRVHLPNMYFTNITSFLIPLEGRYADTAIIFGLIDDRPAGGALHVKTNQPIVDYLADAALCVVQ
jgi:hypothetical protein